MQAVVYKEPGQVAVESVDTSRIELPTDAAVTITSAAICTGTRAAPGSSRGRSSGTRTWAWSRRSALV